MLYSHIIVIHMVEVEEETEEGEGGKDIDDEEEKGRTFYKCFFTSEHP